MVKDPKWLVHMAWRVPVGMWYFLNPRSRRNNAGLSAVPVDLKRREFRGMLVGPWAYMRSRWSQRRYGWPMLSASAWQRRRAQVTTRDSI
jgi:hypothetical protein